MGNGTRCYLQAFGRGRDSIQPILINQNTDLGVKSRAIGLYYKIKENCPAEMRKV